MAIKRDTRYPGRFTPSNTAHPQGAFKNRTAPGAADGSYLEQDWANDWDGFFARLLTLAGYTPNGNVDSALSSQYYDALAAIFLRTQNNLSEIAAGGNSTQNLARINIGILPGALVPIGVPLPYPGPTAPNGYFICRGQDFNVTASPELAAVYPTGTLPDLRGEFIRGWDNTRNVDPGRVLLSFQSDAARRITGGVEGRTDQSLGRIFGGNASGVFTVSGQTTGSTYAQAIATSVNGLDRYGQLSMDSALQGNTAAENRPRNIAYNYIVRAN